MRRRRLRTPGAVLAGRLEGAAESDAELWAAVRDADYIATMRIGPPGRVLVGIGGSSKSGGQRAPRICCMEAQACSTGGLVRRRRWRWSDRTA